MQFGYDDNKIRIKPSFSGQKASCPLCNGPITGKCGDIYIWHWQHLRDRECDPWQEHETEWHRKWKAKFPEDWQEVIIKNEGEKHIADVIIANGIVIEFQNSSISTSTIRIREKFYENMIWIVNAINFADNFKIRSAVSSGLRRIERDASFKLSTFEEVYQKDLKLQRDEIEKNKKEAADRFNIIKRKNVEVEELKQLLQYQEVFTRDVIDKWSKNEYLRGYLICCIADKIESEFKSQLHKIKTDLNKLQIDLKENKQGLLDILKLEDFHLAGKSFKICNYEQIPSRSFEKVIAISKVSRNTFFPETLDFKSESEFVNFYYRKEKFNFAVDASNAINSLTGKIKLGEKSIETLDQSFSLLQNEITDKLLKELQLKIQVTGDEIIELISEWDELIKQSSYLVERQAKTVTMRDEYEKQFTVKVERGKSDQRFKIMKENKGLYTYYWKHERKSWDAACMPIFFDIGETYLFEKLTDGVFKKTDINEFLERHLGAY